VRATWPLPIVRPKEPEIVLEIVPAPASSNVVGAVEYGGQTAGVKPAGRLTLPERASRRRHLSEGAADRAVPAIPDIAIDGIIDIIEPRIELAARVQEGGRAGTI
jgi:hypothetical protein